MITMLLIILYMGGVIGVLKSAPENPPNPVVVLMSALFWPAVLFSAVVQKFMINNFTWEDNTNEPKYKKPPKK